MGAAGGAPPPAPQAPPPPPPPPPRPPPPPGSRRPARPPVEDLDAPFARRRGRRPVRPRLGRGSGCRQSRHSLLVGVLDSPLAARTRLRRAHGEHHVVAEAGELVDRPAALFPDLDPRDRRQPERQRREQLGSDQQLPFVHPPAPHPPPQLR